MLQTRLRDRAFPHMAVRLVGLLGVLVARPALAANSIAVGTTQLTVHYHTAQLRVPYTGDDNRSATVLVRYSKGRTFSATNADTAVVPYRDAKLRRFTGVALWLDANTEYAFRVDVTDADGGSTALLPTYVRTLANPGHEIPAQRVFVSPSGNDANPGTLASPKRTIMAGVLSLAPGGQVRVLPGIYYETAWLQKNGSPTDYYSIVGHGNPDSVIIDGSDPRLLNTTWSRYEDSRGVQANRIFFHVDPSAMYVRNIVAGWGQRLHTRESMRELRDFGAYPQFPHQGWWRNRDTLFVRLENGADPNLTTMHVAKRAHGVRITGQYWRAESLTVRFTADKGYFLGAYDTPESTATGAVIRHCRGYSIGLQGIYGNIGTHNVLVDSCTFEDGRIDRWSYAASKARFEENATGLTSVGRGWVIRNSTFTGHSNGVQVIGLLSDTLTKDSGSDADIYSNRITRMADDGIENDTNQGVNQAIWGNFVSECNFGFSPNPMFTGPVYVVYNIFDSNDAADVKFGGGSTAGIFFYHNTMTSSSCHSAAEDVGGGFKNVVFRNNLFVTSDAIPCYRYPFMDFSGGLDTTVTSLGPIFDHNLWYSPNPNGIYLKWRGIARTWSYLRNSLGWEAHGVVAAPAFEDSAADDFRPAFGSPQVDRGIRILGINTRHKTGPRLYQGYPDLGGNEMGLLSANQPALPVGGPGPDDPFSPGLTGPAFGLGEPWPNPSRSGLTVRLSLPSSSEVDADVYDLVGRRVVSLSRHTVFEPGVHELRWDRRRADGSLAAPGVYFIRVLSPLGTAVQRVVLLD